MDDAATTTRIRAERADAVGQAAPRQGPRIYNLFPLLAGRVSAWAEELPRIARMGFDWVYLNPFHETGFSGSLYAVKNPDRLDPRFRDEGAGGDDEQLRRFVDEARRHGLKVMTDLVVNHTSKDAVLAQTRPDVFVRDEAGDLVSPHAIDPVDPTVRTVWGDLAELNYRARRPAPFSCAPGTTTSPGCSRSASPASAATRPTRCRPRCGTR